MRDVGKRQNNKGNFKKRAHRPWKASLLERTLEETAIDLDNSMFDLNIDFDLDLECTEDLDSFYPEIDFSEEIITTNKNELALPPRYPSDVKITNKLSLGGFFKTQQYVSENNVGAIRKITELLTTLKTREQNVEINEAKMQQAMEQADTIAQQFNSAIDQANKAATAHQAEINLRKQIEIQLKEEQLRANNLQLELQEHQQLRVELESKLVGFSEMENEIANLTNEIAELQNELQKKQKLLNNSRDSADIIHDLERQLKNQQQTLTMAEAEAQQAAMALTKAENLEQQLQETINNLKKLELEKSALQQNLIKISGEYSNFKSQHTQCVQSNELTSLGNSHQEFSNIQSKLKNIIASEQQLRKIAEQQAQENLLRYENVQKLLQNEMQQRKLLEERAKLAIEKSNDTISNPSTQQIAYDYEPEDLNY